MQESTVSRAPRGPLPASRKEDTCQASTQEKERKDICLMRFQAWGAASMLVAAQQLGRKLLRPAALMYLQRVCNPMERICIKATQPAIPTVMALCAEANAPCTTETVLFLTLHPADPT